MVGPVVSTHNYNITTIWNITAANIPRCKVKIIFLIIVVRNKLSKRQPGKILMKENLWWPIKGGSCMSYSDMTFDTYKERIAL